MERGGLISGARCGTNRLERAGPVSNGFGATSPGTCRYTIFIPLERLPEVVLKQVDFQCYRKHIGICLSCQSQAGLQGIKLTNVMSSSSRGWRIIPYLPDDLSSLGDSAANKIQTKMSDTNDLEKKPKVSLDLCYYKGNQSKMQNLYYPSFTQQIFSVRFLMTFVALLNNCKIKLYMFILTSFKWFDIQ